jgi:phosphoenolpyruvate carboxykinase (ATP)
MLRNFFLKNNIKKIEYRNLSFFCDKYMLNKIGINNPDIVKYNLNKDQLFKNENENKEGDIFISQSDDMLHLLNKNQNNFFSENLVFGVDTGKFTGRSPKDKWIVKNLDSESDKNLWWGDVNQPTTPEVFDDLLDKAVNHFNSLDQIYLFDGYCGANKKTRKRVRFVHELAWQQHFVSNMFINANEDEKLFEQDPDFTIINACSVVNEDWKKHNLNSEVAIAFNIEKRLGVILGTWYGGENKKGIFSLMNYWLPLNNIMAMHCSANVGKEGDSALFFGLSGTGKTTLSADPNRYLIGDDEHGWDEDGIFNFEGGCYAKTINLSEENEPDIYNAIKKGALLENVYRNQNQTPDYFNTSKTQNGRVSYPIDHIKNWHKPQKSGHPENIIFLTCDAFGVLPPVAKLNEGQAMYHFLSGYTAKVAGTERGVTEPEATFSACFGAAFLTLHPSVYADLLQKKIREHNCNVYLVNTGWIGGKYGVGERISIDNTRYCIDSILDGSINNCEFRTDEIFNFEVPVQLGKLDKEICNPAEAWDNVDEYDIQAKKLAEMFVINYQKYIDPNFTDYSKYGPNL